MQYMQNFDLDKFACGESLKYIKYVIITKPFILFCS